MSTSPHPAPSSDRIASAAFAATIVAATLGLIGSAIAETYSVVETVHALWRGALHMVLPVIVAVAALSGQRRLLDLLYQRSPAAARWLGLIAVFLAFTATFQASSLLVGGLDGFIWFAAGGAGIATTILTRWFGGPLRLNDPRGWISGLTAGGLITVWVDATFELRYSVVTGFMDPNAVLLTACCGLTLLAGFALCGVLSGGRNRENLARAVLCGVAALGLLWGNRFVVVPRLYLEAHLAIALFEWLLWIGAFAWGVLAVPRRWLQLGFGAMVVAAVLSMLNPLTDGVRPVRADYVLQVFARALTPLDRDGDGYLPRLVGGADCDESSAAVHPFAREAGRDENCNGATEAAPPAQPKPDQSPPADLVVVVTIDTLRPDYMGVYGSDLATTPQLSEVGGWTRFDRAYTSGGITTLAVSSLLSGRLPLANDLSPVYRTVDRRYVFPDERAPGQKVNRVFHVPRHNRVPTVAQVFSVAGRPSFAFVDDGASRVFQKGLGYERGFGYFSFPNTPDGPGEDAWDRTTTTDAFLDALPTIGSGAFVWVHYYDPHNAVGPCRKFERLGGLGCYADAIYDVDAEIGRIIGALKSAGRWDQTVFMISSDHGEALGEHGLFHHGLDSHEEFVRIPLLAKGPGLEPGSVLTPVSLIDISATAVAAAGLEVPTSFQGHDLRRTQRGEPRPLPVASQLLITSTNGTPYRQQTLIVDGELRHMWDRVTNRSWTFDIAADPDQFNPRFDPKAREVVARWSDLFERRTPMLDGLILDPAGLD